MNETTYETKVNGIETDIILPDKHAIDAKIQRWNDKANRQVQLEKKYHNWAYFWKIFLVIVGITLVATLAYFVINENITSASVNPFAVAAGYSALIILPCACIDMYNDKQSFHSDQKRMANVRLAYYKTLNEIYGLFQRGQVMKIVFKSKERYLAYEDETGAIKRKSLSKLDADKYDLGNRYYDDIERDDEENTKIKRPALRFQIDKMQIVYVKPYEKEN